MINPSCLCAFIVGIFLLAGCGKSVVKSSVPITPGPPKLKIAFMPRAKASPYFISCKTGAEQAAQELNDELILNGPEQPDARRQNEMLDQWTAFGVDAIVICCENRDSAAAALRRARRKGIRVITYDADCVEDARDFMVCAAMPPVIGATLMDEAARLVAERGEFAIVTGYLDNANLKELRRCIEERLIDKYPQMKLADVRPSDDSREKAQSTTTALLADYPDLSLVMTISPPALPGAAEAVKQAGKSGAIKVIGLGLPRENETFVKEGLEQTVVFWKPVDLGYLAVQVAQATLKGTLVAGDTNLNAGRLGIVEVKGDHVVLGKLLVFNKDNIDRFNF